MKRIFLALTTLLLAGCGMTFTPHASSNTGEFVPDPAIPGQPDIFRPGAEDHRVGSETRQRCRAGGRLNGWIAIAYIQAAEQCPRTEHDAYNAVLLERYDTKPVGDVMAVCADQGIPSGWTRDTRPAELTCEGARVDEDRPTAILIRRVR